MGYVNVIEGCCLGIQKTLRLFGLDFNIFKILVVVVFYCNMAMIINPTIHGNDEGRFLYD